MGPPSGPDRDKGGDRLIPFAAFSTSKADTSAQPLVQLHFRLMGQLHHDCKALLRFEGCCPTGVATHDQIIAIAIGFGAARKRYTRGLQSSAFTLARTRLQAAVKATVDIRLTPLLLGSPSEVLEDQIGLTSSDQTKIHANSGIVGAGVTNWGIEGKRHADAATAATLEQLGNRQLIDRKVVERQFILGVQHDAMIIGICCSL